MSLDSSEREISRMEESENRATPVALRQRRVWKISPCQISYPDLQNLLAAHANICFFIFKNGSQEQEDSVYAISAILHQIFSFQPELLEQAIPKQRLFTRGINLRKPFEALWKVFTDCLQDRRLRDTICVLDALDECEQSTRALLVEGLANIFTKSNREKITLKLFVTSRPDNIIKSALRPIQVTRVRGEDELEALNHDIRLFVQASVDELAARSNLPSDLLAGLQEALIEGADFTFLWTSLVIQLVKEGPLSGMSQADMESILRTRSLDDIYEHLLSGRPHRLKAQKMLYIVIAAARPLTIEELSIAVEIHQDYRRAQRKLLPPGNKLDTRNAAAIKKMGNSDPSQSYHKLGNFNDINKHIKYPFSNHIRSLCGHFLRIRGRKVYLVHQTARRFLLRESSKGDLSTGYYLRDFQWNISCPTAKELQQIEQHGIPGLFQGRKEVTESQPLPPWRHSLRYDVSNRYMLQVCVDYLGMLEGEGLVKQPAQGSTHGLLGDTSPNSSSANQNGDIVWYCYIKEQPYGAFLNYAARYWVDHYQDVREDVNGYFDYLCEPTNPIFNLWIQEHPSFVSVQQSSLTSQDAISIPRDEELTSFDTREISIHNVLDHFELDKEFSEMWDQENLNDSQYWNYYESDLASNTEEDESEHGIGRKSRISRMSKLPDRIRASRIKARDAIDRSKPMASNPGRGVNSFLTVGSSLRFSSMTGANFDEAGKEAPVALTIEKGFYKV